PALARAEGLKQVIIGGLTHYLDPAVPDLLAEHRRDARRLMLLPGFDELMLGYGDRTFAVPPAHLHRLVPGGNGIFRATVVKAGRVIGLWRRAGPRPSRRSIRNCSPAGGRGPMLGCSWLSSGCRDCCRLSACRGRQPSVTWPCGVSSMICIRKVGPGRS